ncbi:YjbH domain-containing protein [Zemynaea arenosa]|nr:YjbH domain-containing protein [Massilia arenosa]
MFQKATRCPRMRRRLSLESYLKCRPRALALLLAAFPLLPAYSQVLSTSGTSGGLNIPYGSVLPDGDVVIGLNNDREAEFTNRHRGQNYQMGIGLLPYVEVSGRLANYPRNENRDLGTRDLSANIKFALPKLFRNQPDIALGRNDLGGGAPTFRSNYVVVSDEFGPLQVTIGRAHGASYLNGTFGGAALRLWDTGVSALVERADRSTTAGLRFESAALRRFGNVRASVSVQRAFGAHGPDGRSFDRSAVALQLAIPFGSNARAIRQVRPEDEPVWTPPPRMAALASQQPGAAQAAAAAATAGAATPVPQIVIDHAALQAHLAAAGLERVRIGLHGTELVVEFENHRYNRNEADAVGVALGLAARAAPAEVSRIAVTVKKAGLAVYQVSVPAAAFAEFLRGGEPYEVRPELAFAYRPAGADVRWLSSAESAHGWSRIRIDPSLVKFVGTELGVFDYSLAANTQLFVPLWRGAELTASVVSTVAESENVAHGFLGYAQQRNGVKAVMASQAIWLGDQVLNIVSGGRLQYGDLGLQNETTWFVPNRQDQVRLQVTRLQHKDYYGYRSIQHYGSLSYLYFYQPLDLTMELGYSRYVGGDRGPTFQMSRWFGDVQAQVYLRKSDIESRVGFSLAFPLTPRQGMMPGWTHLEGSSYFPFKVETKWARSGECNCITPGVVEELPMVYSARVNVLNQGRLGREYFMSQLPRMREAYFTYARPLEAVPQKN